MYAVTWGNPDTDPVYTGIGPLAFIVSMGSVLAGPGTNLAPVVATPKLDRITRQEPITDGNVAHQRFQIIWQRTMEAIEAAFANQQSQITDLSSIISRLEAAEQQASTAQAQATATAQADVLSKSYVEPSNALTAQADGSVFIAPHTRIYGDGTSVSVNGGGLTGFMIGQYVQVYYDDAARVGGAVVYQGTTGVVVQQDGRHIVGGVGIPAPESSPSTGTVQPPPGYVPPRPNELDSQ